MAAMKATGVWFGLLCFACLTSIGPTVLGLVHVPHQPLRYGDIIMARGLQGPGAHRMVKLRLRGGMNKDDDDSEEEAQKWQGAAGTVAAGTLASGNPLASEPNKEQESSAKGEEEGKDAVDAKKESEKGSDSESESEESVESEKEESEEEKAPVDPKFVREANRRMWEACVQGDEPGVDNAVQNGANVNAFCRGPGEWRNISVGEPQGADASYTGMNLAWFELNNYTAIHLATACGNPGIIEKLVTLGADVNVECLYRVHPMKTVFGTHIPFLSYREPIIYRSRPLNIAYSVQCGRAFFTSYAMVTIKLRRAGAKTADRSFPIVIWLMFTTFAIAFAGMHHWPWDWGFRDPPEDWENWMDTYEYCPKRGPNPDDEPLYDPTEYY